MTWWRRRSGKSKQPARAGSLKVIIETCLLTDGEKVELCHVVTNSGADYIKTPPPVFPRPGPPSTMWSCLPKT